MCARVQGGLGFAHHPGRHRERFPPPRVAGPSLAEQALRSPLPRGTRSCCASTNCGSGTGQTCHLPGCSARQGLSRGPSPRSFNPRGSPVRPSDVRGTKQASRCPVGPAQRRRPAPGWTPGGVIAPERSRAPLGQRPTRLSRGQARKAGASRCPVEHVRIGARTPGLSAQREMGAPAEP